jgi:hypothetical protein
MTGTGNEVLAAVAPSVLRVANDEPDLLALIADLEALAGEVVWAIDVAQQRVGQQPSRP